MTIDAYLTHICQHCGVAESAVTVSITEKDDTVVVQIDIPEEDVGLFIGHHGETLAALQRMTRLAFHEEYEGKHIVLNINDYREERLTQLQEKVKEIAQKILETDQEYQFPYLSSYERFIVHSMISEDADLADLESYSEGEGKTRRLVVRKKGTVNHDN